MRILEFKSATLADEESLYKAVHKIVGSPEKGLLVTVEAMGRTRETLLSAGEKSAQQELVLASTLAESSRTFHLQVAQQVTSQAGWMETNKLLSELFEELSHLLQGIYLMGDLTPQGQNILASCGQRASAIILVEALKKKGVQAKALSARELILAAGNSVPGSMQQRVVADFHQEASSLLTGDTIPVLPALLRSIAEQV